MTNADLVCAVSPLLSKLDEQHFSLKDKTAEYVEDVDHMLAEISEHIDSITR